MDAHLKFMPTTTLTPEVRNVLERAVITEKMLVLPTGQLDRKLYEAVNKVIVNAGGKWNKSAKAHIFPSDPRERMGMTLANGKSLDVKQENQSFYTPRALAARVVELAQVSGKRVLEPSAGHGALAKESVAQGARWVTCIEKDEEACRVLDSIGLIWTKGDFLEEPPSPFDRVVMNPPFTKNQDVKHVRHALSWLEPNGILVAVMSGNTSRRPFVEMMGFIRTFNATTAIHEVEAGAFKESGTMVRTIILVVTKIL